MKKNISSISWSLYGQGGRLVFQTGYILSLAFILGPREYGIYISIGALIIILGPFCGVGFNSLLTKVISTDLKRFPTVFGSAIKITVYSYILLLIFGITIVLLLYEFSIDTIILFFILSIADLLLLKFSEMAAQIFISKGEVKISAHIQNLISVTRFASVGVYYILTKEQYILENINYWAFIYLFFSFILFVFISIYTIQKNDLPVFKGRINIDDVKEGIFYSIGLSSQGVYNDIDKTLMGKYSSMETTGFYGFAYKMMDILFIPVKAVLAIAFPKFFKIGSSQGILGTAKLSRKLLKYSLIYNFVICLIAFYTVPYILENLLNGIYFESTVLFQLLLPIVFLRNIHYIFADALTGAGYQKERSFIQISVASINFVLSLYFISKFDVYGAIIVSIFSDLIMVILILLLVKFKTIKEKGG